MGIKLAFLRIMVVRRRIETLLVDVGDLQCKVVSSHLVLLNNARDASIKCPGRSLYFHYYIEI